MYFIILYLLSFFGFLLGIFHYIKYLERSHFREKCRILGKILFDKINNNYYEWFCENCLEQILILSDSFSGFLEGLIGLNAMIELYSPEKEYIIQEVYVDKIVEKYVEVPISNDEIIIDKIKNILQPKIPLISFEPNHVSSDIEADKKEQYKEPLYKKVEKILIKDPILNHTEDIIDTVSELDVKFEGNNKTNINKNINKRKIKVSLKKSK